MGVQMVWIGELFPYLIYRAPQNLFFHTHLCLLKRERERVPKSKGNSFMRSSSMQTIYNWISHLFILDPFRRILYLRRDFHYSNHC